MHTEFALERHITSIVADSDADASPCRRTRQVHTLTLEPVPNLFAFTLPPQLDQYTLQPITTPYNSLPTPVTPEVKREPLNETRETDKMPPAQPAPSASPTDSVRPYTYKKRPYAQACLVRVSST